MSGGASSLRVFIADAVTAVKQKVHRNGRDGAAHGSWLSSTQPRGFFAAEVLCWFGQAWIASGEVKRGRWMVAQAREALAKSPIESHRRLAAQPQPQGPAAQGLHALS